MITNDIFFSQLMAASAVQNSNTLKASWLQTPLGTMVAIANEQALYLLEFADRIGLQREIESIAKKTKSAIVPGCTQPINSIESELHHYFNGTLQEFKTSLFFLGSPFQNRVWQELRKIPLGQTRSYMDIATSIGKPSAFRAVARANSTNQIALVIPCHRVIRMGGNLGGYSGGLSRKQWLINHEKTITNNMNKIR
jgi:AraC family transcriptional regulator, regulatory protein of adaptative response / methylated-DNA-[protein]-cysteine methyltransferase